MSEGDFRTAIGTIGVALLVVLPMGPAGCAEMPTDGTNLVGEELQILSHSMTTHQFTGSMPESTAVVKGRAQNVAGHTLGSASIMVDFYDKHGNLIGTASGVKQNLGSGEVWDFNVKLAGPDAWKSVDYDIAASASE